MVLQHTPPFTESNIFNEIRDLEVQRLNLMNMKKKGIINGVDVVIQELTKKEFKLKEQKVLEVHSYAITQTSITKNGKQVPRWQTTCGDKRPRCSSYESLIDKLYEHYFGTVMLTDYSFKTMFEAALDERIRTERPKEKTIRDYHSSYKAFISDEFGAKDIRLITPSEVKEYIQNITRELSPTKKRFYKFKGILNLVFNYACDPERRYIEMSPVPGRNKAYEKNLTPTSTKPEDKAFQPEELKLLRNHLRERIKRSKYDVNAYAMLFSSETGLREGEIPSLKWSDITDKAIHIHSQQNDEYRDGKKVYYYNPTTKNEKGVSHNGRFIPITNEIRNILDELKAKQDALGIESEWVFCKENGEWITTVSYYESLYKVCKKLGLKLNNNHAFRIALNSYVYVPMGLPVTERAKLLGHSVDTNLKHYTFARTDDYLEELSEKIDAFNATERGTEREPKKGTSGYLKIIDFQEKQKNLESAKFKAL